MKGNKLLLQSHIELATICWNRKWSQATSIEPTNKVRIIWGIEKRSRNAIYNEIIINAWKIILSTIKKVFMSLHTIENLPGISGKMYSIHPLELVRILTPDCQIPLQIQLLLIFNSGSTSDTYNHTGTTTHNFTCFCALMMC